MGEGLKVFILTEGGQHVGLGHIMRCTSLCQAFEKMGVAAVFVVNGDESAVGLLGSTKSHIFDWLEDRERLFSIIEGADVVIIDSYLADMTCYDKIAEIVRLQVCIDDNMRIEYPKGIVINGSIGAENMDYPLKDGVTYFLGTEYMPLRREFWAVPEKEIKKNIETIMVTFGGNDMRNLTPRTMKSLALDYPGLTKKVIIGMGFTNVRQIEEAKDDRTDLTYYPDAAGMKKVILESDLAVSAGGQTLYELARCGVPTIAISVAGNQSANIEGWHKAGFIEYAGQWTDEGILDNIADKINALDNEGTRKKKAEIGRNLVDGHGAVRAVQSCLKKYFTDFLVLRPAGPEDMNDVFELSNDPEVRRNSFNQESIRPEDHRGWFSNKLRDPNCLFLIASANSHFIGQVRFDLTDDKAVISISIVKEYRGTGIGITVLQRALLYLRSEKSSVNLIAAYVKKENLPSGRFFKKAGFSFTKQITVKNQDAFKFSYALKEG